MRRESFAGAKAHVSRPLQAAVVWEFGEAPDRQMVKAEANTRANYHQSKQTREGIRKQLGAHKALRSAGETALGDREGGTCQVQGASQGNQATRGCHERSRDTFQPVWRPRWNLTDLDIGLTACLGLRWLLGCRSPSQNQKSPQQSRRGVPWPAFQPWSLTHYSNPGKSPWVSCSLSPTLRK